MPGYVVEVIFRGNSHAILDASAVPAIQAILNANNIRKTVNAPTFEVRYPYIDCANWQEHDQIKGVLEQNGYTIR